MDSEYWARLEDDQLDTSWTAALPKCGEVVVLWAVSWAGLYFPLVAFKHPALLRYSGVALSLGNAFSGGVLLSVGFIHMLAESAERLRPDAFALPTQFVVNSLAVCGIMLPLFLEKVRAANPNKRYS